MNRTPIIIDCDVGTDDAFALLLALRLPCFELAAVTSVAGNAEIEKTTKNALRVLELAGSDAPVYQGAAIPMMREQVTAHYVHGKNGFGDLDWPEPKRGVEALPAWDAIYETAKRYAGELTLLAIGPLTNVGLALIKHKDLPRLIKRIVIMGGAAIGGNVTPAAEFNIFADAEAADVVFSSGIPVHMCGLDVTIKAYMTPEEIERLGALGSKQAKFVRDVTQGVLAYSLGLKLPGMCMHDPAAILYAADDSIFHAEQASVRVETKGRVTYGKTVTDLYSDHQMGLNNAFVVTDVDREAFVKRIFDLIGEYGA